MSTEVVERIIKKFGTQERLAEALGINQSVVAGWKKRGVVPARQQPEVLKAGQKLDIDLTPSDFFDADVLDDEQAREDQVESVAR